MYSLFNKLTKRPGPVEHIDKVEAHVAGHVHNVGDGKVDDEVVGHAPHPLVGQHDPDYCVGGMFKILLDVLFSKMKNPLRDAGINFCNVMTYQLDNCN